MKTRITPWLSKDGQATYQVRYYNPGGTPVRPAITFTDIDDANTFADTVERFGHDAGQRWLAARGRRITAMTLTAWITRYLDSRTMSGTVSESFRGYLRADITPHPIGDMPMSAITREDIRGWVKWLIEERGNSGKTVRNKLSFLKTALNEAVDDGHIGANPALSVRVDRTPKKRIPRALTKSEYAAVRDAIGDHYRPFVDFLYHTGARINEVCALTPADIDRDTCRVRIRESFHRNRGTGRGHHLGVTKTESSVRTITVLPDVIDALTYKDSDDYVFTNTAGRPIQDGTFYRNVWCKRLDKAGITPRPAPHDLRHTHASRLIAAGMDPLSVSRRLGHSSVAITLRTYAHWFARDDDTTMSLLSKALD